MNDELQFQEQAEKFRERYQQIKDEIGKVIVGHDEIIHGVLTCMMIGGHCLLEGAPGLGKNAFGVNAFKGAQPPIQSNPVYS